MIYKNIAVLTSKTSWLVPYAEKLVNILSEKEYNSKLFLKHENIDEKYEIVFILSYFRIIQKEFLEKHKHNLVVHESNLPEGKGWSPLFWQILEGKNKIPVVLFEAVEKADAGDIYLKKLIHLDGYELHSEIREKQALKTIEMCLYFVDNYNEITSYKQKGKPSFYKKRTPIDSELDINKSIKDQFNLLRIINNDDFSAFFNYKDHKYIIHIYKESNNNNENS